MRDVRHATRRLVRTPMFTLATVLTLALGIGANVAIFSIVNTVLLKPLPFFEADRLVGLWQTAPGVDIGDLNASLADYITYREESRTLADVALWNRAAVTITGLAQPERLDSLIATHRLLPLLGVQPTIGRPFSERDDQDGSPEVVMLSHGYWQRQFGGDTNVVGRLITVDGMRREIIGVLPKGFWFMDAPHDLVLPLRFNRANVRLAGYNNQAIGRLRPGVDIAGVNADVARMIRVAFGKFPPPQGMTLGMMEDARLAPKVRPLVDDLVGDLGKSLWVVTATIGIVLLIACANVANLLLVRTEGRAQEFAVRAAIGASRGRLARDVLAESLLLGLIGGAIGLGLAALGLRAAPGLAPARLPRLDLIGVDAATIVFTLVVSIAAGFMFGALPVLKWSRVRLSEALKAGGRGGTAGRDRNVTRNTLAVVQVALAVVLLIGSGLMLRTYQSMRRVQPGFTDPATLQTLRIAIPREVAADDASLMVAHQALVERLASLPGVSSAGLIDALPMGGGDSNDPIFASDHTYAADTIPALRRFIRAAPGTFEVLGTRVVAGREFAWTDIHAKRDVVLISENFAREYWGSAAAAIGKQIRSNPNDPWSQVVGVVADIRHDGVDRRAPSTVYWPLRDTRAASYMLRSARAGTGSFVAEIRRAVAEQSAGAPITQMRSMQEVYERSMARTALTLTLLGISGAMALLLAVVGIYALISYTVSQRTREIGIRMAIGAQQGSVQLMFVGYGLTWAGVGAAAGLVAAVPLSRLMSALLFEVKPLDPLTYAAVGVGLLVAAAMASYLPARRVTRIQPIEALRAE
ncbi:ABC transporter permease [Luteitalea pratensis]|nr:ABC transporter permease [Luteitalea pratensis]